MQTGWLEYQIHQALIQGSTGIEWMMEGSSVTFAPGCAD